MTMTITKTRQGRAQKGKIVLFLRRFEKVCV